MDLDKSLKTMSSLFVIHYVRFLIDMDMRIAKRKDIAVLGKNDKTYTY